MEERPPAGNHFRRLLQEYFPWGAGTVGQRTGRASCGSTRGIRSLHNLGLDEESAPEIQIRKNRAGPTRILALEDSEKLPAWAKPPSGRSGRTTCSTSAASTGGRTACCTPSSLKTRAASARSSTPASSGSESTGVRATRSDRQPDPGERVGDLCAGPCCEALWRLGVNVVHT
jgi:hypothetical protein